MKLNTQLVLLAIVAGSSLAAPLPAPGFSFRPKTSKPSGSTAVSKPDASSGSSSGAGASNAVGKTDKDGKPKEPFSKVKWYEDHGTKVNGGIAGVAGAVAIGAAWTNHEADDIQKQTDAKNEATQDKEDAKANQSNANSGSGSSTQAAARRAMSFKAPSRQNSVAKPSRPSSGDVEPHNIPLPPSRASSMSDDKGKGKEPEPRPASVLSQTPGASGSGSNGNGNGNGNGSGSTPHTSSQPDNKPESKPAASGAQSKEDEEKKKTDRKKSVNGAQNAAAGTAGALVALTGGAFVLDNAINKKEDNENKAAKADEDAAKADAQRRSPVPEPLSPMNLGMAALSMGSGGGDLVGIHAGKNSITQQGFAQGSRHTGAKSRRSSVLVAPEAAEADPDVLLLQKRLGFSVDKSDNSQTAQAMQQGDSHTGASSGTGTSLFEGGNGSARLPSYGSGRKHGGGAASSSKYDRRQLAELLFA